MSNRVDIINLGEFNPENSSRSYEASIANEEEARLAVSGILKWVNRPNRSPVGHISAESGNQSVVLATQIALVHVKDPDLAVRSLRYSLGQTRVFTFKD